MHKFRFPIAGALLMVGVSWTDAAAGPITPAAATKEQMVQAFVVEGPSSGINLLMPSIFYSGELDASGTFAGDGAILPFDNGVVLTTGSRENVKGPNDSPEIGFDDSLNSPGHVELGPESRDAVELSFSFIPDGTSIYFEYVFGSDEYLEYVGAGFSDAFVFLLNGQNIALVPGTLDPVTIDTINTTSNPEYFTQNTTGVHDIEYDGLAGALGKQKLFAEGNVNPGQVNTIRLIIGDIGDHFIDSGVFLKGESFIVRGIPPPQPPGAPEPGTMALLALGALGALRRRRA